MNAAASRRQVLLGGASLIGGAAVMAAPYVARAQPRPLDVPYVPTPDHIVEAMLRLADPKPGDFLVDLGCGDGRIPVTAAKQYGVHGLGVDLNPERIKEARANAAKSGVTDKVEFIEGDLFKTDFKKASILTLYLLPTINMALRPSVLEMKPGTRVVSHAFHMEDWTADKIEKFDFRTVYCWVVPADVAGRWSGAAGGEKIELDVAQKFQMLSGSAIVDGKAARISSGKMTGDALKIELSRDGAAPLSLDLSLRGSELSGSGGALRRT